MPKPKKKKRIQTREELIYALCRAAEVEHGLTCIYLFTAFSMKKFLSEGIDEIQRDKIRDWQGLIFSVARQEMEHLGLVCNLLNAIGGAQHFNRPNLPQPADYYGTINDFALKSFSLETMAEFMNYEKPANSDDVYAEVQGDEDQIVPETFKIHDHHTVQELYKTIEDGFEHLDKKFKAQGQSLFIGPDDAQVDDNMIDVGFDNKEYGITVIKINNLQDVKQAIDIIIEQGEGIVFDDPKRLSSKEKKARKLYLLLDQQVQALQAVHPTQKNWHKSLRQIIGHCNALLKILEDCLPLFKTDAKGSAIIHSVGSTITKQIGRLTTLQEQDYSAPNRNKALRHQQIAFNAANYEAEGLMLGLFIEADCHYLKFWEVYMDVKNNKFRAGRNVVDNPMLRRHDDNRYSKNIHIVSEPYTRKAMALFNAGYETMVQMLILFFTDSGITEAERVMLMRTAFFPLMTMFTRPLGQVLTQLPADKDYATAKKVFRAGPSFEYYSDIALMAHKPPNWIYLHERLVEMAQLCEKLTKIPKPLARFLKNEGQLKEVDHQMHYLHTNLVRMAANFANGMNLKTLTK